MEPITNIQAIKVLREKNLSLFDVNDARKVFGFQKDNTLYKFLQRLEAKNIIKRVTNGKYISMFAISSEFEIANFLVSHSYISLESALSFYGILSQFPYSITSITVNKAKRIIFDDKEYEYCHVDKKYFFSYIKKERFLIATPEKALVDELYLIGKKVRFLDFNANLDLTKINKKYFYSILGKYNFKPLKRLVEKYVR